MAVSRWGRLVALTSDCIWFSSINFAGLFWYFVCFGAKGGDSASVLSFGHSLAASYGAVGSHLL